MSWITVIWSMLMGACIALALPHLFMGLWTRRGEHLFFVLAALAVTGIAACELLLMRGNDPRIFGELIRWIQIPIFLLIVGLVGFIHTYLGQSRLWLGIMACGIRFLCLVLNFVVKPNLTFESLTGLRYVVGRGIHSRRLLRRSGFILWLLPAAAAA